MWQMKIPTKVTSSASSPFGGEVVRKRPLVRTIRTPKEGAHGDESEARLAERTA